MQRTFWCLTLPVFAASLLLVACLATPTQAADDKQAKLDEVLARFLRASGGLEAHQKLKSRRVVVLSKADDPQQPPVMVTLTQKAPNKRRMTIRIPEFGTIVQTFNGKTAWEKVPEKGVIEVKGKQLTHMVRDAPLYPYLNLKGRFKSLRYVRHDTSSEPGVHVIEGIFEGGDRETISFHDKTYLIQRVERSLVDGAKSTSIMRRYKRVDGVMVHFEERMVINEQKITVKVQSFEHNIELDDKLFEKPEE